MATLNGRQKYLADKYSSLLIRESSDLDERTSVDDEMDKNNEIDIFGHGTRIFKSTDAVDKRFVDLYKLQRFKQDFKNHARKEPTSDKAEAKKEAKEEAKEEAKDGYKPRGIDASQIKLIEPWKH